MKKKHNYYHCPKCNFIITKNIKNFIRFDFACPKCKIKKLSSFKKGV